MQVTVPTYPVRRRRRPSSRRTPGRAPGACLSKTPRDSVTIFTRPTLQWDKDRPRPTPVPWLRRLALHRLQGQAVGGRGGRRYLLHLRQVLEVL